MSFAAWRVDNSGFSLQARGAGRVLPVRGHFTSMAWRRDPEHFHRACTGVVPFCASDPHAFPQKTGKQSCCRAGVERLVRVSGGCVTRPARRTRGPAPGPDETVQGGGRRMLAAALPDRRIRRPPAGSRSSSPLRTARPRHAQAAPLVMPCLRDHRHRLERDALVHRPPGSAAHRRPAMASGGHRPRRHPDAVPVPRPRPVGGKPISTYRGTLLPGRQDADPARGCRDEQGRPAHLTPRCRHRDINHSRYSAIHTASTERGQFSTFDGGYPLAYSQPVHRSPDVTRGIPQAAVAACNRLILS